MRCKHYRISIAPLFYLGPIRILAKLGLAPGSAILIECRCEIHHKVRKNWYSRPSYKTKTPAEHGQNNISELTSSTSSEHNSKPTSTIHHYMHQKELHSNTTTTTPPRIRADYYTETAHQRTPTPLPDSSPSPKGVRVLETPYIYYSRREKMRGLVGL